MTLPDRVYAFFVLNAVNLADERTTCAILNYKTMKEIFKKVFSDVSLLKH